MLRRGSIVDSKTGKFSSRSKKNSYRKSRPATTSRPIDRTDVDDTNMSEVPSSFPNIEDNYMFRYQHLLGSDNYPGVDGDRVDDEETDTDETINEEDNNDQNEDCHQSGSGQNSEGNNVCIKRMGFDTEINPVTKKRQLSLYGRTEFNNASCGREIGNILRCNFKGPWHSWDKVDLMYKDELFKEFKKKYDFPVEDEEIVRNIWEVKARISLNQLLARARSKALAKLNTTNITDCIDNGPIWIQKEDWNKMRLEVWSTEEFHRRSDASKRNRLKQTDGKISSHCGGSVSFASYRASMQQQAGGKELPWDDVFSMLHKNVNQSGTFVDNRSKTVVEKYRNEMIEKYGPNRDVHPSFDGEAWCQASGGVSKGRVYGAPRMPASKKGIDENWAAALEYNPESFARVIMLYVDMEVNGVPLKAFVDSGAQSTIISKSCAERCGLLRLLDQRYKGIAHGVGQSEILGRIHVAPIKIGNIFYPCSFMVLDSPNMEFLFGLDMLRKHQCIIDLKENVLRMGGGEVSVPFLQERDIPPRFLDEERYSKEASSSGNPVTSGKAEKKNDLPAMGQSSGVAHSSVTQGSDFEAKVAKLVELGFGREAVIQALKLFNGNEEQAAGFLFGG